MKVKELIEQLQKQDPEDEIQIDRECDIIIQICSHLVGLIDSNYGKEIITHIRDNGDME